MKFVLTREQVLVRKISKEIKNTNRQVKRMIDENKLIEDLIPLLNENGDMFLAGKIIGAIDRQPKVGGWIPVSERLPEEPNYYEVTVDFGSEQITETAFYSVHESRWGTYKNYITAWRERLPEPYKAGD